jgi:hypothetical protein
MLVFKLTKQRKMRWARHVARVGHEKYTRKILVGKSKGMRSVGVLIVGGDNIKIKIGCEGVGCFEVAQYRVQ